MLKLQNNAAGNHGVAATNSHHGRLRLCEAYDRAPAAFLWETDAAALCAACDSDIHTANSLAPRHLCVPIPPPAEDAEEGFLSGEEEEGEAASWLLLDSVGNGHVVDLEFDEYNSFQNDQFNDQSSYGGESVVQIQDHFSQYNVSPSPAEVAVVPESRISEVPITTPKGTIKDSIQMGPTPLTQLEREARVLRYREKKKMRKFAKTIRYASRKTYAEARPRIKGRFVKRKTTDIEDDTADHMIIFSASLIPETGYSIVPTF